MDEILQNETLQSMPANDIERTKELQNAKARIYEYLDEGLEPDQAFLLVGLSDSLIQELNNDSDFMICVKQHKILMERKLLRKLHDVIDINVPRGKSDEILFLLQAANPEKYGGKRKDEAPPAVTVNIGGEYRGI